MRSSRRSAVPPFAVMDILGAVASRRAAGLDVFSLCAGEPGGGAPTDVRRRAAELLAGDQDLLGYTAVLGITELRTAIAAHYSRWYGVEIDPAQVAVTTGSSGAFVLTFLAAFDAGDRVAVARPGYPAYRNILASLGLEAVDVPCGAEVRYQPTPALLDAVVSATGPIDGLVLASPANPTGTMVDDAALAALVAWCEMHGVRLVSDEIYHGIVFGPSQGRRGVNPDDASVGTAPPDMESRDTPSPDGGAGITGGDGRWRGATAWSHGERSSIVVSSFSKYWGMTGWRLGWALLPEELVGPIDALAGNHALSAPSLAQHAALACFSEASYGEADEAVAAYARHRDLVLDRLPRLGWRDAAPADGAFYVYADLAPTLAS